MIKQDHTTNSQWWLKWSGFNFVSSCALIMQAQYVRTFPMLLIEGISGLAFHPYNTRMIAHKGLNGLTFHPYNRRMIAYNLSLQRQHILRITNRGGSASLLRRKQAKSKLPGVFPGTRCRRHLMHEFVVRPERMRSTGCDLSVPFEASLPPTARVLFPKKKHPTHVRGEDLCWLFLCRLQPIVLWVGAGSVHHMVAHRMRNCCWTLAEEHTSLGWYRSRGESPGFLIQTNTY